MAGGLGGEKPQINSSCSHRVSSTLNQLLNPFKLNFQGLPFNVQSRNRSRILNINIKSLKRFNKSVNTISRSSLNEVILSSVLLCRLLYLAASLCFIRNNWRRPSANHHHYHHHHHHQPRVERNIHYQSRSQQWLSVLGCVIIWEQEKGCCSLNDIKETILAPGNSLLPAYFLSDSQ